MNIWKRLGNRHLKSRWWIIIAFSLLLVISTFSIVFLKLNGINLSAETPTSVDSEELEPLTIYAIKSAGAPSGGGAFVKKTWVNANPWTEDVGISVLPVFANTWERYENNTDADYEAMEALVIDAARYFGFKQDQFQIQNHTFQLCALLDGMQIYVNDEMTLRIYFDQGVPLPKKYNVTKEASYEEKQKAAQYIRKKYKKLINMEDLQVNVRDGENNNISLFAGANDLADRIVNYNFNTTDFYINKDGLITSIIIYRPDLSQKIGNYPIISVEEAKELLVTGHYIGITDSAVRNEEGNWVSFFPGLEYVLHVELVYLPSSYYNVHIPYYAFYAGSLYYVPAIDSQYIINMPMDGYYPETE